jgi:sirohydrochlorin ferrochelatase
MLATRSAAPKAPATEARCLLLVSHGIDGRPGVVTAHAAAIRAAGLFPDVRIACVRCSPTLAEGLAGAPRPVTAVPLLMADGFIMQLLRDRLAGTSGVELRRPVGTDPRVADLIEAAAAAACVARGWEPVASTLLLVAHGTDRHPNSAAAARWHARNVAARTGFAEVRTAFLDQASFLADTARQLARRPCVAVGLFVDDGPHGRDDVLAGLAEAGVPVAYTGAIGGDPAFVDLILAEARRRERVPAAAHENELMALASMGP